VTAVWPLVVKHALNCLALQNQYPFVYGHLADLGQTFNSSVTLSHLQASAAAACRLSCVERLGLCAVSAQTSSYDDDLTESSTAQNPWFRQCTPHSATHMRSAHAPVVQLAVLALSLCNLAIMTCFVVMPVLQDGQPHAIQLHGDLSYADDYQVGGSSQMCLMANKCSHHSVALSCSVMPVMVCWLVTGSVWAFRSPQPASCACSLTIGWATSRAGMCGAASLRCYL
jgi:hypothetical protein